VAAPENRLPEIIDKPQRINRCSSIPREGRLRSGCTRLGIRPPIEKTYMANREVGQVVKFLGPKWTESKITVSDENLRSEQRLLIKTAGRLLPVGLHQRMCRHRDRR